MFMKQNLTSHSSILNSHEGKKLKKIQHNHQQRMYIEKIKGADYYQQMANNIIDEAQNCRQDSSNLKSN